MPDRDGLAGVPEKQRKVTVHREWLAGAGRPARQGSIHPHHEARHHICLVKQNQRQFVGLEACQESKAASEGTQKMAVTQGQRQGSPAEEGQGSKTTRGQVEKGAPSEMC